jgi:hypothetical protein
MLRDAKKYRLLCQSGKHTPDSAPMAYFFLAQPVGRGLAGCVGGKVDGQEETGFI